MDRQPDTWTGPAARAVIVLLRGLRRRCPRCGERKIFRSWYGIKSLCPRCGLRFEKEEGGFVGAMTVNYLVTTGLWVVMLIIWLIFTVPDVPVAAILLSSIVLMVTVPLVFYPRSKTIWASFEYLIARSAAAKDLMN